MDKNSTPLLIETDVALPRPAGRWKPIAIALGALTLVGFVALLANAGHASAEHLATNVPTPPAAITPAPTPSPVSAPTSPAVTKPEPVIAAAVASPHDEEATTPKTLTAADHLKIARKLEREAQENRRLAAAEYRREAAQYARTASADRRKAANNARMAHAFQRLAMRSMRRG